MMNKLRSNLKALNCRSTRQLRYFLLVVAAFIGSLALTHATQAAAPNCRSVFMPVDLKSFAAKNFNLYLLAKNSSPENMEPGSWWLQALKAITTNDTNSLKDLYQNIPQHQENRAYRLLMHALDQKLILPELLQELPGGAGSKVAEQRLARQILRSQEMSITGDLSPFQKKEVTYLLAMLGVRRSKLNRMFQKSKAYFGFESNDLEPIIPADSALTVFGDEARILVNRYNQAVSNSWSDSLSEGPSDAKKHYVTLTSGLFHLYSQKVDQTLTEPWFQIDGKSQSLHDFINSGAFRQTEILANNTWMNVVTLTPDKVQNPQFKGLSREMWWNRLKGIDPIGTVRIARNTLKMADGSERVMSIEVLRRGEDGLFVPYLFEADAKGNLNLIQGKEAQRKSEACFQCHLRLSGIFFGGITMPNYRAVDDWHINAIDFTRRKFYKKFENFKN